MRKSFIYIILSVLLITILISSCGKAIHGDIDSSDIPVSVHSRDYYSEIKGNNKDSWLLMFFINADEVEKYGMASYLIAQLLQSPVSDKLSIMIQTYGTEEWSADFMGDFADRIMITNNGIQTVSVYTGDKYTKPHKKLQEFVSSAKDEIHADRNALIFWGKNDMSSSDIAEALTDAKLDFVAFDTESNDSFEDVFIMRNTADYYIGSSSTFATSWNFSQFISTLSKNPSYICKDLTKILAHSMLSDTIYSQTGTLNSLFCVDLTMVEHSHELLSKLLSEASTSIEEGKFSGVAYARNLSSISDLRVNASEFSSSLVYQSSEDCKKALSDMIVYSSNENFSLSLYMPSSYDADINLISTIEEYQKSGLDYSTFIPYYISVIEHSNDELSREKWFKKDIAEAYKNDSSFSFDDVLDVTYANDTLQLNMKEGDLLKISSVDMVTYADTGEYYILLGNTPFTSVNENGYYLENMTDEWISINSQPVYVQGYLGNDGETHYLANASVNDEKVKLVISDSAVTTYLRQYGIFTVSDQICVGDIIQFYFEDYSQDELYLDEKAYGYKIAVANGLTVSSNRVDIGDLLVKITLTDISGRKYSTDIMNIDTIPNE